MLLAPLEQFQILSLFSFKLIGFDLSITNFLVINLLSLMNILFIIYLNNYYNNKNIFYYITNTWQFFLELNLNLVSNLLSDIITKESQKYLPFILTIFNFIFFSNLIGLLPYSFTSTSHLFITFNLSFSIFIGINLIIIRKYNFQFFSIFLPSNTSFLLALILVPIEFVSYIAKPVSLGVRLFINLMAGHTLLKVIVGFSWSLLELENFLSLYLLIPIITLIILFGLELGVALIQTYVFIILTCIYIQDGS